MTLGEIEDVKQFVVTCPTHAKEREELMLVPLMLVPDRHKQEQERLPPNWP